MAHPETSHPHVDVPVLLVLLLVVGAVVVVAVAVRARDVRPARGPVAPGSSWEGGLTWGQWVVRALSVVMLILAVWAGRAGVDDELENIAPALVVGAGWPLLVATSLLIGTAWRWVDPWDALARVLERALLPVRASSSPAASVWPAVLMSLPWLWLLAVHPRPLDPRLVGAALALYSVVTVAGCLALGRVRWLSSAEPVGLLLSWTGLLPRRALTTWRPPVGASALLGCVTGGLLFAAARRTELWSGVAVRPDAVWWATAALLLASALGAAVGWAAERVGGGAGSGAAVTRAMVPVAAGVALAVTLGRNRFTTSVQLLPGLLGDPFGRGWDLWGEATAGLDPAPLGAAGLVALQLGVVAGAHVLAAATAPRPLVGDDRLPVIGVLALWATASVVVLSWH